MRRSILLLFVSTFHQYFYIFMCAHVVSWMHADCCFFICTFTLQMGLLGGQESD